MWAERRQERARRDALLLAFLDAAFDKLRADVDAARARALSSLDWLIDATGVALTGGAALLASFLLTKKVEPGLELFRTRPPDDGLLFAIACADLFRYANYAVHLTRQARESGALDPSTASLIEREMHRGGTPLP